MLLLIDNYDSFTFNLVHYFQELGVHVEVYRNDHITLEQIEILQPSHLVISPGPCTPNEAGISLAAIQYFYKKLPVLGVCLGHQSIGQFFGGQVIRAATPMHGKTSWIYHNEQGIFKNLANPTLATRYHSLIIDKNTLPDCLEITAWTQDAQQQLHEIMAIQHKTLPLFGVQFHPESILTEQGHLLLKNFLSHK